MKKNFVSLLCIASIMTVPALTIAEATENSSTENTKEKSTETTSSLDFSVVESSEKQMATDESKENLNITEFDEMEDSISSSEMEEDNIEYKGDKITEENQSVLGNNARIEAKSTVRSFSTERNLSSNALNMPRIDFVDVSSHQGEITVQDYINMKGQGVTGVVVKLTEGTSYINPFAYSQIRNAQAAGLKVSAYHYSWFVNKKTAEAEARYFAQVAQQNGLGINTVMVNDAEEQSTNNGNLTQNSLYFMETLNKEFGFKQVVHYSMASWFTPKILDMSKLGGDKVSWKAQFPFVPSKDNLLHTESSAWQWSSDMHFVGDSNKDRIFDTNIDYTGTFSSLRNFEYIPFSKKTFINKTNADIYNQPYQSGAWRQDITLGMSKELITISAQSRTSYGLWYEFMYQKDGINKVGWIKSNDVSDIIDEKDHQQTLFVKKATGSIYDSPYVPGTEEIDKTSGLENDQFNKTKEARTGYGLWYYGSYIKEGKVKTGWIKSVDLEAETVKIEAYTNKGIINKNYGAVYESPYMPGVSEKDTLVGLQEEVVTIKSKSQTNSGLWYESTYKKNGVTKTGWIKSRDIDFIRHEKNHNQVLYVNKEHGAVYDTPYTSSSSQIDTTKDFKTKEFKKTKEARTGYGLWYYGSYTKEGKVKTGWIKSADLETEIVKIEAYTNKGIINKNYGAVYESPYIPGVYEKDTLVGLQEEVVTIKSKSQTNSGLWYESTYKKNGVTKTGWIKSRDIDFIRHEKNHNQVLYVNKEHGAVYDTPYTSSSSQIDTTKDFKTKEFKKTKEARTGYGLWYYGSYTKEGKVKTGWIKSVDFK